MLALLQAMFLVTVSAGRVAHHRRRINGALQAFPIVERNPSPRLDLLARAIVNGTSLASRSRRTA